MKQMTLAAAADQSGFDRHRKPTRRDAFLAEMQTLVPWSRLVALIEPHYPKAGNGRPPIGLERMLRIHLLQHWFNLPDLACEEALYDSNALRSFAGIDLGREPVPDATTLCKFRHLLEQHELGQAIFSEVGRVLQERGLKLSAGTIVDATIIAAPSSTKNAEQQRDPEMHQTKKGNQWHFGMKLHIGAESKTGLVHSAVVTSANVHDKHPLPQLLRGTEKRVYGDRGYQGCSEIIKTAAPHAQDFTNRRVRKPDGEDEVERLRNRTKSKTRARVEHPFLVLKRLWGFAKVRYRGAGQERQPGIHGAGDGELVHGRTPRAGIGASVGGAWQPDRAATATDKALWSPQIACVRLSLPQLQGLDQQIPSCSFSARCSRRSRVWRREVCGRQRSAAG